MQITKQQLSAIEYALELARYFCDEHNDGFHAEQNASDWETYENAMEVIRQLKVKSD